MSIIMGALAGAGDAGQQYFAQQQKVDDEMKMAQTRSDLDFNKSKLLLQAGVDSQNQQREAQVARIGAAAQPIIDNTTMANANAAYATPGTPSNLTMDDLSDEEKQFYQPTASQKTDAMVQAGVQTGDVPIAQVASNASKGEINQMKMDSLLARSEDRNQSMAQVAQIRADSVTASAQLRVDALTQRATNGKIDTATGRMLITSEDANIKASSNQLSMLNSQLGNVSPTKEGKPNPAYTAIADQMDSLRDDIKSAQANKSQYLKTMGLLGDPAAASPAPAPAPGAKPASGRPSLSSFQK